MRILIICQHFYPEQFRINDIALDLLKKGNSVTVLTGLPNYPSGVIQKDYRFFRKRKETYNGIKIIRCGIVGRGNSTLKMGLNYVSFLITSCMKALFLNQEFDIVYCFQLSPISMAHAGIIVKKRQKIPFIIHCLDQWPISLTAGGIKKNSLIYKIALKYSKYIYNGADKITISSKSFERYFNEVLKIKKSINYWPSYAEDVYCIESTTNNDKIDLVFAGNIGPAQSVETIIECANYLKKQKNIIFHIIGDGLNKKKCMKLAKSYNLSNVVFYGFYNVEQMEKFYELADAFVITMDDNEIVNNTLPAKIQSYMLAKKPIFGAASGEVNDIIKEAKCGVCCNSLDAEGMSKLILEEIKMINKWKKYGINGFNYYKKHFEKEKLMNELEKILEDEITLYGDGK